MKICIDQGHYPNANKGVAPGYYEGNRVFTLGCLLKEELERYDGVTAILTRNQLADNPTLERRGELARVNGCDLFLSVHTNAAGASAAGVSVIYSIHRDSKALADRIGKAAAAVMAADTGVTYYRSAYTRLYPDRTDLDYYGVIRSAVRGAVVKHALIVEHGFHTNAKECAWLNDDANLRQLAAADAGAIAAHFGLTKAADAVPAPAPAPVDSLQVGDRVTVRAGVTTYADGKRMASWVPSATLYVRRLEGDRALVSTEPTKEVYTGRVLVKDLVRASAGAAPPPSTPPAASPGAYGPRPAIVWDFHPDAAIRELQEILCAKGKSIPIDGMAGDKTYAAVKGYTIEQNDRGPLTKWVQQRLNAMGYACGAADGIAGAKTMNGIAAFQRAYGLGVGYLGGTDWYYILK